MHLPSAPSQVSTSQMSPIEWLSPEVSDMGGWVNDNMSVSANESKLDSSILRNNYSTQQVSFRYTKKDYLNEGK